MAHADTLIFLDTDGNIIDDMIFAIRTDEEMLGVPNALNGICDAGLVY